MSRRSRRNFGTTDTDYVEAAFSGIGALAGHSYLTEQVDNPMLKAAMVGVGTATGGAAANYLEGKPTGFITAVDVPNSIKDIVATGLMYYFLHEGLSDAVGDKDVAAFLLGVAGNWGGQQLPTPDFLLDMFKES